MLKSDGDVVRGAANVAISSLFFALSGAFTKLVSSHMDAISLVSWRNLFSMVILFCSYFARGFPDVRTPNIKIHVARSVCTYFAMLTYFYAVGHTALSNAVFLMSSGPIFVPLLAIFLFHYMSDRFVWAGVFLGVLGIAFIITPGTLSFTPGELSGLVSGLFSAGATIAVWRMSIQESAERQIFYFTIFTLLFSLLLLPFGFQLPSRPDAGVIALIAACTLLAQYFLSVGYSFAAADKVMGWSYLSIIFAMGFGYGIWGEKIGVLDLIGTALIFIGARLAMRLKKTRSLKV